MKKYVVTLTEEERAGLHGLISAGKAAARKLVHARVLLKADASPEGAGWDDGSISEALEVGTATTERIRKQFVEEGLEAALAAAALACCGAPKWIAGDECVSN